MSEDRGRDIVDLLLEEHEKLRRMLRELDPETAGDEQFRELVAELVHHEVAEEEILYPAFRLDVQNGGPVADQRLAEEAQAEEALAELEKLGVEHTDFAVKFEALRRDVLAHAEKEEQEVFPALQRAEDPERRRRMGQAFDIARRMAPTHPHPHAPDTPPGNVIVGPFAAIVDRARDAARRAMDQIRG